MLRAKLEEKRIKFFTNPNCSKIADSTGVCFCMGNSERMDGFMDFYFILRFI